MQESIPEWKWFEEGLLNEVNVVASAPLVSDPKMKIESLFDDNNEFKFQGFKPVPWRVFMKQNKDDPIGEEDLGDKDEENQDSSSSSSDEEEWKGTEE